MGWNRTDNTTLTRPTERWCTDSNVCGLSVGLKDKQVIRNLERTNREHIRVGRRGRGGLQYVTGEEFEIDPCLRLGEQKEEPTGAGLCHCGLR